MHNTNLLELKAVASLSGMEFVIKDYQRGYRWSSVEVEQLLDDFAEFVSHDKNQGEFYCLQPVVVRKINEEQYEVIDGQQRLTTLNLLLQYLSDGIRDSFPGFKLYGIEYATRPESKAFLANIKHPKVDSESYIDFHFMAAAYKTIEEWFRKKDDTVRNEILRSLLEEKKEEKNGVVADKAHNIRVIWYEVSEDETTSSVNIFTRLNIGKIPLTDAELVKALFLSNSNYVGAGGDSDLRKINLSTEWNAIEQHLHDDRFWYFLNRSGNPLNYSSRIEFIFDVISGRNLRSRKYHTFEYFHDIIKAEGADVVWLKVKNTYNLLNEWYSDRELYHIIGYLLEQGVKIEELRAEWKSHNKTHFRKNYLRQKVKGTLPSMNIAELSYESNRAEIRKVLLLFNILTVLQKDNSDMRFPFNRFKTEKWDIEHVCSQTDRTIEKSDIPQWCKDILEFYLSSSDAENIFDEIDRSGYDADLKNDLLETANLYRAEQPDKGAASNLFFKFQERFKENDSLVRDKDSIANLALLDSNTNRGYGNAFFPIKRKRIIENDSAGVFVPIATKNLFLKYYSPRVTDIERWTAIDSDHYLDAIQSTIEDYISQNNHE